MAMKNGKCCRNQLPIKIVMPRHIVLQGNYLMKYPPCLLFLLLSFSPLSAAELSIATLLEAAGKQPDIQAGQLTMGATAIHLEQARAELNLKFFAFENYERYNSPTNLRPMSPAEVDVTAGESLLFSEEIERIGPKVEMPLFVKGRYALSEKVKQLQEGHLRS